jgi:anaerobic selenocysteine-containing dehydrogenase
VWVECSATDARRLGSTEGDVVEVLTPRGAVRARVRVARHRKRSGDQQPSKEQQSCSGAAIAVGALLDGIPESVVLGLTLLTGGAVSPAVLVGSSSPTCLSGSPAPQA